MGRARGLNEEAARKGYVDKGQTVASHECVAELRASPLFLRLVLPCASDLGTSTWRLVVAASASAKTAS